MGRIIVSFIGSNLHITCLYGNIIRRSVRKSTEFIRAKIKSNGSIYFYFRSTYFYILTQTNDTYIFIRKRGAERVLGVDGRGRGSAVVARHRIYGVVAFAADLVGNFHAAVRLNAYLLTVRHVREIDALAERAAGDKGLFVFAYHGRGVIATLQRDRNAVGIGRGTDGIRFIERLAVITGRGIRTCTDNHIYGKIGRMLRNCDSHAGSGATVAVGVDRESTGRGNVNIAAFDNEFAGTHFDTAGAFYCGSATDRHLTVLRMIDRGAVSADQLAAGDIEYGAVKRTVTRDCESLRIYLTIFYSKRFESHRLVVLQRVLQFLGVVVSTESYAVRPFRGIGIDGNAIKRQIGIVCADRLPLVRGAVTIKIKHYIAIAYLERRVRNAYEFEIG